MSRSMVMTTQVHEVIYDSMGYLVVKHLYLQYTGGYRPESCQDFNFFNHFTVVSVGTSVGTYLEWSPLQLIMTVISHLEEIQY